MSGELRKIVGDAFEDVLAPIGGEIRRLRRALSWRLASDPPTHEDAVIVVANGDQFFAVYRPPEGDEPGYWDRDIEYGGEAVTPDLWFDLPPTDNSILAPPKAQGPQPMTRAQTVEKSRGSGQTMTNPPVNKESGLRAREPSQSASGEKPDVADLVFIISNYRQCAGDDVADKDAIITHLCDLLEDATMPMSVIHAEMLARPSLNRQRHTCSEDYVVVPREPTEAMIEAGFQIGMQLAGSDWASLDIEAACYRAMIAAAPNPARARGAQKDE